MADRLGFHYNNNHNPQSITARNGRSETSYCIRRDTRTLVRIVDMSTKNRTGHLCMKQIASISKLKHRIGRSVRYFPGNGQLDDICVYDTLLGLFLVFSPAGEKVELYEAVNGAGGNRGIPVPLWRGWGDTGVVRDH